LDVWGFPQPAISNIATKIAIPPPIAPSRAIVPPQPPVQCDAILRLSASYSILSITNSVKLSMSAHGHMVKRRTAQDR
jgi:hypothetical protein